MATGKIEVLFSGVATSNSYQTKRFNIHGFGESLVWIRNLGTGGSGVTYTVLGYPATDMPNVLNNGILNDLNSAYVDLVETFVSSTPVVESGKTAILSVTDGYGAVDVGVKSAGTNFSTNVTVIISGKRRS
jgi:hypothetical protein